MIRVTSMMLAPTTLPTDMDACFLTMDVMAVTSSGRDVPRATIVTAMIASDTPSILAISVPLLTNRLDPMTIHTAPTAIIPICMSISFLVTCGLSLSSKSGCDFAERIFSSMNRTKITSSTAAPIMDTDPPSEKMNRAAMLTSRSIPLGAKSFLLTDIGMKTRLNAMISAVLQMTEPMPLPIAMDTFPSDCSTALAAPETRMA